MKRLLLTLATAALLIAQRGGRGMLPACGLGQTDHPCHCTRHVEQVQSEYMASCEKDRMQDHPKEAPGETMVACMAGMPQHCDIIEHYGNWETDDNGEHVNPMPDQCRRACTRSHCQCADGPVCHLAHSPQEDRQK